LEKSFFSPRIFIYATLLTALILFSAAPSAYAQESIGLQKTWGGTSSDYAIGVAVDDDGNIYVVGVTASFGAGSWDVFVVKYNPSGVLQWQKTYGGTDYDGASDVASGSVYVYVVGSTNSPQRVPNDVDGTETTPSGVEGTPTGTETTPSGEPSGGNVDAFLISLVPRPPVPPDPTVEATDGAGVVDDYYLPGETVYIKGSGFSSSTTYQLYVVNDADWYDEEPIPSRVPGTETNVTTDSNGDIPVGTVAWNPPLTTGKYDVVVDVDNNGKYDQLTDALDDGDIEVTAGFLVIPELPLGTATALTLAFGSLMLLRKRRTGK